MAHVHSHPEDKRNDKRFHDFDHAFNEIFRDEPKELVVDPELANYELPGSDYAYPCAECDTMAIVQDPYVVLDPVEHLCGGDECKTEKWVTE